MPQNVPTQAQLDHRYFADGRTMTSDLDRWLTDEFLLLHDMFGSDGGMTTSEREAELAETWGPHNVNVINGVGYGTDGVTTLYDDDGDGVWDSGLMTGTDGSIYQFGPNGWGLF